MNQEKSDSRKFRILSIDGGGLRGVLVIEILKWIEENILGMDAQGNPKSIADSFDLIAGTSTGALIACALTVADKQTGKRLYTTQDIWKIYEENGSKIFPNSKNWFSKKWDSCTDIFSPRYDTKGLTSVLTEKFADKRILDCNRNLFIPTYNIERFKPLYFTSRQAREAAMNYAKSADKLNCTLKDVCLATTAAPTYLPSHILDYTDKEGYAETLNCIDGGVYLNNPALAAYVEVINNPRYYRQEHSISSDDIYVLSIGTGIVSKMITAKEGKNKGELFWAKNVISAAMLGNSQTVEQHLSSILPGRHLRINLDIKAEHSEMDDSSEETFKYLTKDLFINSFVKNSSWESQLISFRNLAGL